MVTTFWLLTLLGFAIPMSIFFLPPWGAFLWTAVGVVVAYVLTFVIFAMIHPFIFRHTKLLSKYRGYMIRSTIYWVNRFILNAKVKSIGKKNIPKTGPTVLFSNHKSFIDPLVLIESIPRVSGFAPKSSLYKIPILRTWLEGMHCLKIDRQSAKTTAMNMVKTIKDIKSGYLVSIFPEGTARDRDSEDMAATKAGAFKVAVKSQATIVPVTLIGTIGTAQRFPLRRSRIKIIYHPAIKYEDYADMNTAQIGDMVLEIVNQGVKNYNQE